MLKSKGTKVETCRTPKNIYLNELHMESVLTLYLNSHIDILIFIAKPHECNLSINKDKTIYKFFGRSFISVAKKC